MQAKITYLFLIFLLTFDSNNCKLIIKYWLTIEWRMDIMNSKTKEITLIGLMTAVTCIAGPLSLPLPFSPVPISLTNLAIYFSVYILGMRRGTISYLVYLLLGFVGLPVFSAFTSGPAKLFGPTGGYLIGFIFMALICGYCIDRWNGQTRSEEHTSELQSQR